MISFLIDYSHSGTFSNASIRVMSIVLFLNPFLSTLSVFAETDKANTLNKFLF